jgi:hypothetical protein
VKTEPFQLKIDPDKFTPASYVSFDQSGRTVPIETIVETKDEPSGAITTEIFSITRFRPFTPAAEEFYLVYFYCNIYLYISKRFIFSFSFYKPRSGVYCVDKKPGKDLPKLPQSFVYYAQVVPGLDGEIQEEGIVESLFVIFIYF